MINREKTEVREVQIEIEKFIAEQPEKAQKLQEKAREFNRELRHLLLIHSIAENNPIEFRNTLKVMDALKKSANSFINPINEQIKNAGEFEKSMYERKEEYSKLAEDKLLVESARISREYVEDLIKLLAVINTAKKLLTVFPHQIEDFLLRLEQKRSDVEKEFSDSWKTYFFTSTPKHYFTSGSWELAYLVATKWLKFVALYGLTPSEEQKHSFNDFILKIIFSGLIVSLICYLFLRWLGKKLHNSHTVRYCLPFSVWAVFGLSTIINAVTSDYFQFGAYQAFGEILLAGSVVSLAWNLRRTSLTTAHRSGYNILWPLWLIFAAGITVQALRVPIVTMTPLFTVLLIICSVYYYLIRKHVVSEPEQKLSIFTTGLTAILAVTTLLGWGSLSMLISALWFMVVLNIVLGSGLSSYFWRTIHSGKQKSISLILLGNMVLPLIFIGLFTLIVVWASIYTGGMPLLMKIIQWKKDWGMISLRITTLLTLAALFFIARSFIAFFHTAIKFLKIHWENIEEGVIKSLQTLSSYVIWFCYVIVSLNFLGIGIGNLTIIAGGLSVGVGFALQDLIKNFVSGLILLFGRSIHPGDEIQLEDVHGRVEKINIRSTVVQTNEDSTIFLPNSDLVSKKIVNWTHKDPKGRAEIIVGVAYGSDTNLIKDLLIRSALSNPDVLKEPPPYVLFNDFGDNALIFHLRFWIMHVILLRDKVRSVIRFEIDRVFKEHNIKIAYPQRDIHIRSVDGLSGYLKTDGTLTDEKR
ncbi:MAG: mechanosensitive ion channel [Proteobacteria bacterium]|nr:mechanosensitive ion channel [Pseudomonadota bacterium]